MGRRRKKGGGGHSRIPYDFVASFAAGSKNITCADLGIVRNRSMKPVRISISAAIVSASQLPACYITLNDTKEDTLTVSRSVVLGATARSISVSAPRSTDFGDYKSDNSNVATIICPNWYNGTVTASGTVWMDYAPHKVTTRVALCGPYLDPAHPLYQGANVGVSRSSSVEGATPSVGSSYEAV